MASRVALKERGFGRWWRWLRTTHTFFLVRHTKTCQSLTKNSFATECERAPLCYMGPVLRVGLGQNGQILFISVEQLSLNVAADSAKTLSVIGNMGGVVDDCGLRFVQMRRRPPQNTPDLGGPTDFFKILPKKDPYRNHTKSMN